jgi:hypothetical protein
MPKPTYGNSKRVRNSKNVGDLSTRRGYDQDEGFGFHSLAFPRRSPPPWADELCIVCDEVRKRAGEGAGSYSTMRLAETYGDRCVTRENIGCAIKIRALSKRAGRMGVQHNEPASQ